MTKFLLSVGQPGQQKRIRHYRFSGIVHKLQLNISHMKPIIEKTVHSLRFLADPKHLVFSKTMANTSLEILGIITPDLKIILKQFQQQTNENTNREKIDLAIDLVKTDILELGQMAYLYLGEDKQLLSALTKSDLKQLNHHLDNWATVDAFGVYVHGKVWQLGTLKIGDIEQLACHEDVWQRRLALVSTIPLNRKSTKKDANPESTLQICSLLIDDHHDMIVKAMSWALRELGKREPDIVRKYIKTHEIRLHKRILREVNTKLDYGTKTIK